MELGLLQTDFLVPLSRQGLTNYCPCNNGWCRDGPGIQASCVRTSLGRQWEGVMWSRSGYVVREPRRDWMEKEHDLTLWEMLKLGKSAEPTAGWGAAWRRQMLAGDVLGQSCGWGASSPPILPCTLINILLLRTISHFSLSYLFCYHPVTMDNLHFK